jgi:hypothetical protein
MAMTTTTAIASIPPEVLMEHRKGERKPTRLTVELGQGRRSLGRFKTRNISFQGMFIEAQGLDLSINEVVEVTLPGNADGLKTNCLRGLVVHRCGAGVGLLLLLDYDPSAYPTFRTLLQRAA